MKNPIVSSSDSTDLEQQIIDFWNSNPCGAWYGDGDRDSAQERFLEIARFRDRVFGTSLENFVRFENWRDRDVLEIGCGIGNDAVKFMQHGARYVGMDVSTESIMQARYRAEVLGLTGRFENRDASLAHSFTDLGRFDLVYSNGVIHHWPNLAGFIDNMWSALVPDGFLFFSVYATDSWDHVMSHYGLSQFEAAAGCPYVATFSKEQILQLLGDRFQIENLTREGCFMYNVDSYRKKELVLEPWFDCMPAAMRQAIDTHYGKYYYVKARKVMI